MVVFAPPCPPAVIDAYSTVPLLPEVRTSVLHDFNIGSFARFHQPRSVISIHDRPEFYGLSQLDIRLRLDRENRAGPFVIIDETTAESHALWWVTTTEECDFWTKEWYPAPITYPGEEITLWHLHIMTQVLPWEYGELTGGDASIAEDVAGDRAPYDPHDPQEPPFGHGSHWDEKETAEEFLPEPLIIASPGEWEWTDDPQARRETRFSPVPRAAVRLTSEAAKEAGLIASWFRWNQEKPEAEQHVEMHQKVDWDSPKWPWDGVVGDNKTQMTTIKIEAGTLKTLCEKTGRLGRGNPRVYRPQRLNSSYVTVS
ncbi:MAG: hypothetical protein L6R41_008381 [Letrouitia leprolyta]|nr:MAG: hypothetical protein L6R41_008381 [Letrouitia leprolyta]